VQPADEKEYCAQKAALAEVYERAAEDYLKRVQNLEADRPFLHKAEYQRLRRQAELARSRSERARADLEAHIREHGC